MNPENTNEDKEKQNQKYQDIHIKTVENQRPREKLFKKKSHTHTQKIHLSCRRTMVRTMGNFVGFLSVLRSIYLF